MTFAVVRLFFRNRDFQIIRETNQIIGLHSLWGSTPIIAKHLKYLNLTALIGSPVEKKTL